MNKYKLYFQLLGDCSFFKTERCYFDKANLPHLAAKRSNDIIALLIWEGYPSIAFLNISVYR